MPVEWAIIFLGSIIACAYFSYQSGQKNGIELATILTLEKLESEGLIHFGKDGKIQSGSAKN